MDLLLVPSACPGEHRPQSTACAAAVGQAVGAVEGWAGQVAVHGRRLPTQVRTEHLGICLINVACSVGGLLRAG
jgi:hypothetical protein